MSAVDEWVAELSEKGDLTPTAVQQVLETHGARGRRAIEGVGEQRVKQYNDFTVVVGRGDEYIVEGRSCLCPDSRYNLDRDDPDQLCWHVIAVLIAGAIQVFETYDQWYAEVGGLFE